LGLDRGELASHFLIYDGSLWRRALGLYARYWRRRDALQQDLERLLRDALDYLKVWAGDTLEEVTEGEVAEVADWFYSRYVSGSLLERLIGGAQFRAALWAMFTRWRDMFIGASYALVK